MSELRDKIFTSSDIQIEMVEIPEWGVTVEVRGMSGGDRSEIIDRVQNASSDGEKVGAGDMVFEVIVACAYDPETGRQVFTEDDIPTLRTKAAKALDRIAEVGFRLSGMDGKDGKAVDAKVEQFPAEPAP